MSVSIIHAVPRNGGKPEPLKSNNGMLLTEGGSSADGATAANQDEQTAVLQEVRDRLNSVDFATQAALSAIQNKLIASPATEAKQDAIVALSAAIRDQLLEIAGSTDTLEALLTTLNGQTDALERNQATAIAQLIEIRDRTSSLYERVQNATDKVTTFIYTDEGTADERVTTIVSTSASLNATFTDTYTYAGISGAYRVSGITRTQS